MFDALAQSKLGANGVLSATGEAGATATGAFRASTGVATGADGACSCEVVASTFFSGVVYYILAETAEALTFAGGLTQIPQAITPIAINAMIPILIASRLLFAFS